MDRLLADPGLVQRRLEQDLSEVAALGRSGVRADPGSERSRLVETLHSEAHNLEFDAPIVAATQSKRRLLELSAGERREGTPVHAYYASATATVHEGALVKDETDSGGARILTFLRQAAETPLATMALATEVTVEADGRAHFEAHGWPTPPAEPVHTFEGTAEELLRQALSDLADDGVPFDRALLLLWGARLQAGDPVGDEQQRIRVAQHVAARSAELDHYLTHAENYALAPSEQWWYAACLYRSALENLFESYLGGVTFSLVSAEDIDDVDEKLREKLPLAQATPSAVPDGVPEGHWWWKAAASDR
ncbi:hypothetical protein GCM10007079_25230 [Nocardiopsis terrae]|uniref:Uncharacterized protein n=1 Tax=Nocardiopsis terrae TaxID=372655 RepID=A0ABR9HFR6_9ACTN|nr:hypothetical protein [Nocardiopsis terrae]MBE1457872.1 hypothetical protein [Nocardiopsis terrae]GHC83803.1 hypothetical protein GCM10007079_25230 [Nocardiopsis terrae]